MRRSVVLASLVVLASAASAHAGRTLTTGSSSFMADFTECRVVNVSTTKTVKLNVQLRNKAGVAVVSALNVSLSPFQGSFVAGPHPEAWCEFTVLSGGARDIRANMSVLEGGTVAAMEIAR